MPNENIRLANLLLRLLVKRKQMGKITSETILFTHCPEQSLSLSSKSRTLRNDALAVKYYMIYRRLSTQPQTTYCTRGISCGCTTANVQVATYSDRRPTDSFILPAKGKIVQALAASGLVSHRFKVIKTVTIAISKKFRVNFISCLKFKKGYVVGLHGTIGYVRIILYT